MDASILSKVSKISISKSLDKKQQSTRKLSRSFKINDISVSYMSVQRYLIKDRLERKAIIHLFCRFYYARILTTSMGIRIVA